jgi:glutamate-ammonia-ligase adenylyltransferase
MIDIEFIVQYLVLQYSAKYAELTGNIGNIALLHLAGRLGLVDATLAGAVADAYRDMRRWQHQLRLQGQEQSRIEPARVALHAAHVTELWRRIFETAG